MSSMHLCQCATSRLDMGKLLAGVVVFLSLLAAVYLTASYYVSGILPPLLRGAVPNAGTLTNSRVASARTRDASDSFVAVDADGNFSDRVQRFNDELHSLRQRLRLAPRGNDTDKTTCQSSAAVLKSIYILSF